MNSSDLIVVEALANGRMGKKTLDSGAVQNTFLHVTSQQRAAGLTDYVKVWWKIADVNNGTLLDPEPYQDKPTKSLADDDYVVKWLSDPRTANTQAALAAEAATATKYGSAYLAEEATAGTNIIDIAYKAAGLAPGGADPIFRSGDKIKVCSHADAISTNGVEEVLTLASDPVLVAGLVYRLTTVENLLNTYLVDNVSRVSSLIPCPDIKASVENFTVNTAGDGDYNLAEYPLVLDNIGTIEEDITHSFTGATTFDAEGDTRGGLGSGSKDLDFSPVNADFSRPIYTMAAAGYTGTFALGDSITFTIHPAGIPIGQKRVVKAGAGALSNNSVALVLAGEAN